jgi:hypothetical protein
MLHNTWEVSSDGASPFESGVNFNRMNRGLDDYQSISWTFKLRPVSK